MVSGTAPEASSFSVSRRLRRCVVDLAACRVGYATGATTFTGAPGGDVAADVASLTVTAPADGRTVTIVTATVHVNAATAQQSTWNLDVATNGGAATTEMTRVATIAGATTNPGDTITLTTEIIQEPGDTDVVTVSGTNDEGTAAGNIEVEITSVTASYDAEGNPPADRSRLITLRGARCV